MKTKRVLLVFFFVLLFFGVIQIVPEAQESTEQTQAEQEAMKLYQERELTAPAEIKSGLEALRNEISSKKYSFQVGYTKAMDYRIEQITGLKVPPDLDERIRKQNIEVESQVEKLTAATVQGACSNTAASFDWRTANGATPVRNQGACGSCWAFSTLGAFEGAFRIKNNVSPDSSEQDLLDCNPWGYSCLGGWWAFQHLIDTGIAREAVYPYTAAQGTCKTSVVRPCKATVWGYVSSSAIPSVSSLKQAMCQYGPLSAAVLVTPFFQAYTGGVLNEQANTWQASTQYNYGSLIKAPSGNIYVAVNAGTSGSTEPSWPVPSTANPSGSVTDGTVTWTFLGTVNHGVTLIGWDDSKSAWLIKNSWGTTWGTTGGWGTERGYMWIDYNCDNIGYAAAWVQVAKCTGCSGCKCK